jgi:hypothetical protein
VGARVLDEVVLLTAGVFLGMAVAEPVEDAEAGSDDDESDHGTPV